MKNTLLALLLMATASLFAQSGYKVGDKIKDFPAIVNANAERSGTPEKVNLANYKDAKGVVVVFTCNHCPYAIKYEDRLVEFHKNFAAKGYPILAINPNDAVAYPDDSFENMKARASEKSFPFAYAFDETQTIAKAFGATRTPHIFVLNKKGKNWVVSYIGALDDDAEGANIQSTFLANAVESLLKGQKPDPNFTKAIGCSIKWKKS